MTATSDAQFHPERTHNPAVDADWYVMWPAFEQAYAELVIRGAPAAEPELRRELLFCLLGGHGVPYEMNCSALRVVDELDVFAPGHEPEALRACLEGLLDEPRFEPIRKNGGLRRYRFPRRKAGLICQARGWVLDAGSLVQHLAAWTCGRDRRRWMVGCPGVGPKSASWLLRNTGWAHELAILDVHVMRAMIDAGIVLHEELPGDYERIEELFLQWCERLEASPGVFDLFLWEWQRGTLRPRAEAAPL